MPEKREVIINGYGYPSISPIVLEQWISDLTNIYTFSYGVNRDGSLTDLRDYRLTSVAEAAGVGTVMVLTPFNEQGQFSNEIAEEILRSPEARQNLIEGILATLLDKNMSGVDFDFEFIKKEKSTLYVSLVQETAQRLHPYGLTTTVALAPKTSAGQEGLLYSGHDYAGMGQSADYTLLMTYEWGYTYGPPMAVAPINKVREVLEYGLTEIPAEKILMGIPNYGYDWTLPFVKGESIARKITIEDGFAIAESYGVEILYDEEAQAPYFTYIDEDNLEHIVWFENQYSLSAKLSLIEEYGLAGAAYWNIMSYYPGNSQALNGMYKVSKEIFL